MTESLEFYLPDEPLAPEPLRYDASGLEGVRLLNGFVLEDDPDLGPLVTIEQQDDLHRAIALHIIEQQRPMTGPEIRFLRKLTGRTQAELARELRVDAQTVANYEKGRGVPEPSDLLMRVIFTLTLLPQDATVGAIREVIASDAVETARRALPAPERRRVACAWRETPRAA
jgi:DNA-binding transcriptional regulator YiaG